MLKISLRFIVLIGLIFGSLEMHLKQNATTSLTNTSLIPSEIPPKDHPTIPLDHLTENNDTKTNDLKPKDEKPIPPAHPSIELHPTNETKKPEVNPTIKLPPMNETKKPEVHSLNKTQVEESNPMTNKTRPVDIKTTQTPNITHPLVHPQIPEINLTKTNSQMKPNPLPPTQPICNRNTTPKSLIYFNLYDTVTNIRLNGNDITQNINKKEASDWAKTHTLNIGLCEGDIIQIAGKNSIGRLLGMIGTIHFKNQKGIEKLYNTGPNWNCDGKKATVKGIKGSIKGWSPMPLIDSKAEFIWNDKGYKKGVEVICFFKIPMN